jgi:hypothetical protein
MGPISVISVTSVISYRKFQNLRLLFIPFFARRVAESANSLSALSHNEGFSFVIIRALPEKNHFCHSDVYSLFQVRSFT